MVEYVRQIYSKVMQTKFDIFLRPNFVDIYNYDMDSVYKALRTNYVPGQGLLHRKWWQSIFLWAFDIAIVNSYLLYKSHLKMHGFEPKLHYTYQGNKISN